MNQKLKEELLRPLIQAKRDRQRWLPKYKQDNGEEDMDPTEGPLHIQHGKKIVSLYTKKRKLFCSFQNKHYAPGTEEEEQWRAQATADCEFIQAMYGTEGKKAESNADLVKKCNILYQALKYAVIEWETPDQWLANAQKALKIAEGRDK